MIWRPWSFVPEFIIVYLMAFVAVFVPALVIPDRRAFRRTALRYLILILVSFIFFLAFPFSIDRVESPAGDGLSLDLLRWFQSVAKPYNSFPSLHVSFILLAAVSCLPFSRRAGIAMFVFAALVVLSTLFCKLHNVLDIVAGIAVVPAVMIAIRGHDATQDSRGHRQRGVHSESQETPELQEHR